MSTKQYQVDYFNDFFINHIRFRRDSENNITLIADYSMMVIDSRTGGSTPVPATDEFLKTFTETSPLSGYGSELRNALITVNNSVISKLMDVHFP